MKKTKTVLYSIWLTAAVCHFILLPSLAQSQGRTATLTVGDGSGAPGSQGNQIPVALNNDVSVGGMQLEICDEDDYLTCTACSTVERSSGFLCVVEELQERGCCRMLLIDLGVGTTISTGEGTVFTLTYDISSGAPAGACRGLDVQEAKIPDENLQPLAVTSVSGEFCFSSSTTTTSTPCPSKEIYGENSQETQLLRSIRDDVLSKTQEGQELIKLYYQWSPTLVKAMQQDKDLKADMRKMIDGLLLLMP